MKKLTVTKAEFELLYIATSTVPSDNETELETSFNMNRKYRLKSVVKGDVRGNDFPARDLLMDEDTFLLEDSEWTLTQKRLTKAIPQFHSHKDEELFTLVQKVKNAPKYEPAVEPEND